ncbi:ORF_077R [Scale drop disease virus]|uniref:ORF_077R n=1 Tax=Scale drop disease virus TaxID=1697349 RepID=A0A0K1L694_9VIRU|nr:ORF_077R [Scale drop disease virus]AKU37492.1 ORF_077R [Scale drop disease virus]
MTGAVNTICPKCPGQFLMFSLHVTHSSCDEHDDPSSSASSPLHKNGPIFVSYNAPDSRLNDALFISTTDVFSTSSLEYIPNVNVLMSIVLQFQQQFFYYKGRLLAFQYLHSTPIT